ncbi:group II intron maturase-specific domain-containing protein [Orientia tsutsugamushi]|uniref:group II intron maturase-specific domain-containing protein n=1 Tax=Orientia tsutsugamushi TaxID=784 RepID=UPI0011BA6ECA
MIILIDSYRKWKWLEKAINIMLRQELSKINVELNEKKTKTVDLRNGETFSFLGFDFRLVQTKQCKIEIQKKPKMRARTSLLKRLKEIFRKFISQPVDRVIHLINPILRGWINYFRIGNSSRFVLEYVMDLVEKKVSRHLIQSCGLKGFRWKRWSRRELYEKMELYNDYQR